MNLGSSASDLQLTIVLLFPALIIPFLLLGAMWLLGRVLRLHALLSLLLAFAVLAAILLGASVWLDSAGQLLPGRVEQRRERVDLRRQGDWQHELSVELRYNLDRAATVSPDLTSEESATTLKLAPAQYDRLSEAAPVQLRVLPLYRSLALVRLADTSTMDFIPWTILGLFSAGLLALLLLRLMMRTTLTGILAIVMLTLAAFALPLGLAYQQAQASENLAARPLREQPRCWK